MQKFDASGLSHALVALTALDVPIQNVLAQHNVGLGLGLQNYSDLLITTEKLELQLGELECFVSQLTAKELLGIIRDEAVDGGSDMPPSKNWSPFSIERLQNATSLLRGRILDELKSKYFLSLNPVEMASFDDPMSYFGEEIASSFPEIIYDLEEGMKSLALSRYTACVFHLMRSAEQVVSVVAASLHATVAKHNGEPLSWGVLVGNIKPKIDMMIAGPVKDEWHKLHALLHSVNRAYRTKTAHPAAKYNEEEAKHVVNITRDLLRECLALLR